MIKAALYSTLSKKMSDGEIKVIESLKTESHKTKNLFNLLKNLKALNSLLVAAPDNKLIFRACSNIPKIKCLHASSINTEDVLKYKQVLIDKEAVSFIK